MKLTFDALQPDYERWLADYKPLRPLDAHAAATRLLVHRDRFLSLQEACGVPALWVMPVFVRENPSFNSYLGNGQPLTHRTTEVPAGRGPFDSWEEGAADALKLDDITEVGNWTWAMGCYEWEKWNGFGPRRHGRPTGYVTAGTNIYAGGKYISDGVWSRGTWDHQLGTLILAKTIAELDPEIGKGFA